MPKNEKEQLDYTPSFLACYDIGAIHEVGVLTSGLVNDVFLIKTSTGDYVLKRLRTATRRAIENEVRLFRLLKQNDFPGPDIIEGKDGEGVSEILSERGYLYRFIEGFSPESPNGITITELQEAARTLARYHMFVKKYPTQDWRQEIRFPYYNPDKFFSHGKAIQQWRKVLHSISRKGESDDIDRQVAEVAQRMPPLLEGFNGNALNEAVEKLPILIAHGDYHGGNLVFGPDGKVRLALDWEFARPLARAWEVQYTITLMCKTDNTENFNTALNLEKCRAFIDAYREILPISEEEIAMMPIMAYAASLWPPFLLEAHYFKGSKRLDRFFPRKFDDWFWWQNHYREYYEAIK